MSSSLEQVQSIWVCRSTIRRGVRGMFFGHPPLTYATSLLLAQLIIASLLSSLLQYFLTPLGESAFISMVLVGLALGPSLWGDDNEVLGKLYPKKSYHIFRTVSLFGCALFLFVVGAKTDLGMVKRSGKKAVVIGILTFLVPLTLNLTVAGILRDRMQMDSNVRNSLFYIAMCQSMSSFHVIGCLLADLNLLNSELGRLALSSSMISGTSSWVMVVLVLTIRQGSIASKDALILMIFSAFLVVLIVVCILRPAMIWMVRKTSEGQPIRESFVFSIFLMVLGSSFLSEVVGQHFLFGPMALGMAVPDGPPLGSAIVNKLESLVSSIFLPSYFVSSVSRVNLFSMHSRTVAAISIMCITSFIGKLLAAMLPSLYCKMPVLDAFSLGLIMSSQGITDVLLMQNAQLLYILDLETYSIMVITMVVLTGTFTPVIKFLYNPSKKYRLCQKRGIQQASPNAELRILACIYNQDYAPSLISLLEVSNPTARSPICCYVIHLIELTGRLSPLLVYHKPGKKNSFHADSSSQIINAFRYYEKNGGGKVIANIFTAISPFTTIHEEVCRLALEKRTSLVIIPFHRQWTLNGVEDVQKVRAINRQILSNAPCSVGILIDRGSLSCSRPISSPTCTYNSIGIIFIHGKDDREALAYAMRMAEHPKVSVTMVHLIDPGITSRSSPDKELDNDIISEFTIATVGQKRHFYKEETLKDSVEMVNIIRSLENSYDLICAGRNHDRSLTMFAGLTEWHEFPELGFVGDMLASSDSVCKVSALVIQQETSRVERGNDSVMRVEMEKHPSVAADV